MQISRIVEVLNGQSCGAAAQEGTSAVVIPKEALTAAASLLRGEPFSFESLHCISAVDRRDKIELVYHLFSLRHRFMLTLKVFLPPDDLSAASLTGHWKSADWLEREIFDLFGIRFLNHPGLRRILNPEDWTDFPLRKDYQNPNFRRLPQTEGLKSKGQ